MRDVIIAPVGERKGRTFRAISLAYIEADRFWTGGASAGDTVRPIWAMFGGSDNELRAFCANLLTGRKATFPSRDGGWSRGKQDRMEFLRSAGYATIWQRETEGSLLTIYLPELVTLDPGLVDPEMLSFVMLPSQAWCAQQNVDSRAIQQHLVKCGYKMTAEEATSWAPLAYLFATYVDRRTRCPLVADGRFYAQLLFACLRDGLATFAARNERTFGVHERFQYYETNTQDVGLMPGLAFLATHETFETLLAQEVTQFLKLQKK